MEYKIETINDIINATNADNIDAFLDDLRILVLLSQSMRIVGGGAMGPMVWKDDGLRQASIAVGEDVLTAELVKNKC